MQIAERLDPPRFESTVCASRFSAPSGDAAPSPTRPPSCAAAAPGSWGSGADRAPGLGLAAAGPAPRRERVDVLHAHKFGSNVWGDRRPLAGVPVVVAHEQTWSYRASRCAGSSTAS